MNPNPNLDQAAKAMRNLALSFDVQEEMLREAGFKLWQVDTLFPQAVNRWIEEAGNEG